MEDSKALHTTYAFYVEDLEMRLARFGQKIVLILISNKILMKVAESICDILRRNVHMHGFPMTPGVPSAQLRSRRNRK